jgi:hypothetical protein
VNSKNVEDTVPGVDNSLTAIDRQEEAADTRAFLMQPFSTHGERLARAARAIINRRIPVFPWVRPLETIIEHLASLPTPAQERFQRIEAQPHQLSLQQQPGAQAPGWSMGDSSRTSHLGELDRQNSPGSSILGPATLERSEVQTGKWPLFPSPRPVSSSLQTSHLEEKELRQPSISGLFAVEHDNASEQGQPLPSSIKQQLQSFVGPGTEAIRIHDDGESDALAQASQADAVTLGSHIFFRQDRFRPQEDAGFALLTHEALHVVRVMQSGTAWRRATQAGIQEEEQEASAIESQALHSRRDVIRREHTPSASLQVPISPVKPFMPLHVTSQAISAASASTPAQQPMRASTDRTLENGERVQSVPTVMPNMDELKRALYRDLIRQIKADLERGG